MYKILQKKMLTPIICLMDIEAPHLSLAAKPGQFLITKIDEKGERIPLTICDYDHSRKSVTIVFQIVGTSTERMALLEEGDFFQDIVGPLGQSCEFLNESIDDLKKKKYLFIAGGVGTAPVYPQVKWFYEHDLKADVIIGTRCKETLILEEEMRKVADNLYICTDDGSYGTHGNVTVLLEDLIKKQNKHYDHIVIIGPMIMMKFASLKCKEYNIDHTVSLNPLMVDGTGMCGACRVTIGDRVKFACVDGPEFDGRFVDFEEAMKRQNMYKTSEGRNILQIREGSTHHNDNCPIHNEEVVFDKFKRVPVREQEPNIRNKNFDEVCYGYNLEEAKVEAQRCLNCKNPICVSGCPVSIDIPGFIQEVKNGNIEKAGKIINKYSSLPAVCGRVCPQETQCEGKCILGIKNDPVSIGKLERFVGDYIIEKGLDFSLPEKINQKVAVIGSGPAGLTAAGDLAKLGYNVTVFEALHKLGGVLSYGIPEFRLPKEKIVDKEIDSLKKLGVIFITDCIVGKTITIDQLLDNENFDAVFIGSGAGLPKFMDIPGETLNGIVSANEFLTRINLMKANETEYDTPVKIGQKVGVIGGGNVAMDAARTAKRLGADSYIIYRRGEEELPARREEIEHAKEEGIKFMLLVSPIEFIGDENNWLKEMKMVRMALGEPDESGRAKFSQIKDSEFTMEMDTVIMSLGTSPNPLISSTTENLSIDKWNCIVADEETGQTSRKGVFAGGDAVTGAATVILAMEAGKKAATAIDKYLKGL